MDELALLDALAGIDDEPAAPARAGEDPLLVVAAVGEEDAELEGLLAIAAAPPAPRRRQAPGKDTPEAGMVLFARQQTARAKRGKELEASQSKRAKLQLTVAKRLAPPAAFAREVPGAPSTLVPLDPTTQAMITCVLAFSRTSRGDRNMTCRQNRAAARVASFIAQLQRSCYSSFVGTISADPAETGRSLADPAEVVGGLAAPAGVPTVVKMILHQFDTTKQRAKNRECQSDSLPEGGRVQSYTNITVMMQEVQLHRCTTWPGGGREVEDNPIILPATVVERQNANHYLHSLLQRLPASFEKPAELLRLARGADYTWFVWTVDRDINNALVLDWLVRTLCSATPRTVLPHVEMCALHGVQLAKDRYPHSKACALGSVSLCKQFRHQTFRDGARQALKHRVRTRCRVRHCKRPDSVVSFAGALFAALFGDRSAYGLYEDEVDGAGRGERKKSTLLCRVDRMLESFDIERRPDGTMLLVFCHWCIVEEEDPFSQLTAPVDGGHRRRCGGRRCCGSDAEGREKIVGIVCDFVLAATWAVASVNRWAYMGQVWRKMLLLCLLDGTLMGMLEAIRRGAGLDLSLEDMLARAIAENPDDFSARNQLKTIRLCKSLGQPDSPIHMVVGVILGGEQDRIHYAVLGRSRGKKVKRASLLDLVNPTDTVIGRAEDQLVQHADSFRADCSSWLLLDCIGVGFASQRVRLLTRAALMRQHTGLVHHFTKKFSSAPYSLLLTLPNVDVPLAVKREISEKFVSRTPRECLSPGAQRMQDACSSGEDVQIVLRAPLEVFGDKAAVSTDNVERAHAQVRQDLRSATRARDVGESQNRVVCRQTRAAHLARKGSDPAVFCPAVAGPAAAMEHHKNNHPGSAKIRHRNHKMKVWKALHAPSRKMIPAELEDVRSLADQDWVLMEQEERQQWGEYAVVQKSKSIGSAIVAHQQPENFRGLWDNHTDSATVFSDIVLKSMILPAEDVETVESVAVPAAEELANDDDGQVTVPNRCQKTGQGWGPLWGCAGKVKNLCRLHGALNRAEVLKLNALTAYLNRWVRLLGRSTVDEVNSFAWFKTDARAEDGSSLDRVCLLSDCIYQPWAQYLTRCHLPAKSATCFTVPEPPFKMRIGASHGSSRLRGSWRSFWTVTSDEFALELARTAEDWSIIPLECECDLETESLRDCIVTGFLEEIPTPSDPRLKRTLMHIDEMSALGLPDDCSVMPPDCSSWVAAPSAEEEDEAEESPCSDLEAALEESERGIAEEAEAAVPLIPEVLLDAGIAGDGAHDAGHTLEDYVRAARVSDRGVVECDLPPWRDLEDGVGQLKEWPLSAAPEKRQVALRCLLHSRKTNCCIVRRRPVTNEMMLRWLFSAEIPAGATCDADMAVLALQHKEAWG